MKIPRAPRRNAPAAVFFDALTNKRVVFDALRNIGARPVRRHLGDFETVSCERAVGVALGLVLLNMSRLSSRLERRRMQGDMAALVGKDVELPPSCPCWREDCAGSQPGVAAQALVDSVRVYASLGLERHGDPDAAVTRLLHPRLAADACCSRGAVLVTSVVALTLGCLLKKANGKIA